jgi:hypothetical protein
MEHDNITFIAKLIEQYGILKVAASMLLAGFAIAFPILVSWLKDASKRKSENKLVSLLSQIAEDMKMLAQQYSDSLSVSMVEVLLENIYRKQFWELYDYARNVIEKNDVDNDRTGIEARIKMQTKIAFKAIENNLSKFRYKSRPLSEFMACGVWESEISTVVINGVFEVKKIVPAKRIYNMRASLNAEFDNIHFLTMQNINNF